MGMGAIAWTCLLLSVHQAPPRENFLNARDFEIPMRVAPQRQNNLRRLILLVSRDRGATWQIGQQTPPSAKAFRYHANDDGSYWFIVQEEDNNGRTNPRDPARVRPNQCLIVDTVPPKIDVKAEHLGNGDIHVHWNAADPYPEERSLRLEYHTNTMRPDQWTPLPPPTSLRGEHRFPPGNGVSEVIVRMRMQDKAGNSGLGRAKVSLAGGTTAANETASFGVIPTVRREQSAAPGLLASRQSSRPATESAPQISPLPSPSALPTAAPPPQELKRDGSMPVAAPPLSAEQPAAPSRSPSSTPTPNGALPPKKIVNKREVRLDFEVSKVGPSGLGGADVYVTLNEGASWNKLPNELPLNWPDGGDGRGPGPVRGSVSVQLPNEDVIYGFIVNVKSRAGRAAPAPKSGQPPQARVEMDISVPKAQLFGPIPANDRANALILAWSAADRNLAKNPITLEWAERIDGPWTVIGDQLPNNSATGTLPQGATGSHMWQLPERMPSQVYLKLTALDIAGNRAIAQTDKPVLIDLSVPETRNLVVGPSPR